MRVQERRAVSQYTPDFKLLAEYQSIGEAVRVLGITHACIRNSCIRRGKYCAGGFRFVYEGDAPYWKQSPEYSNTWHPVRNPEILTDDGRIKYEVSGTGAVRSMARNAQVGRMLRVDDKGCVILRGVERNYIVSVSSLVAEAF